MADEHKTIYLMVGIPASGKSTYINKLLSEYDAKVYSTDALRAEIDQEQGMSGVDESGHQKINIPFDDIYEMLRARIMRDCEAGLKVAIFDATFTNPTARRFEIEYWRDKGFEVNGVVFGVSRELAKERNLQRDRKVNPEVIDFMADNLYNNPVETEKDRFTKIYGVDEAGQSELLYERSDKELTIGSEFRMLRPR